MVFVGIGEKSGRNEKDFLKYMANHKMGNGPL